MKTPPRRIRERSVQYTPGGTHFRHCSVARQIPQRGYIFFFFFCFSFHFVFVFTFRVPTIVRKGNDRLTRSRPSGIDHSPDVPGVRIKTDMCFQGRRLRRKKTNTTTIRDSVRNLNQNFSVNSMLRNKNLVIQ